MLLQNRPRLIPGLRCNYADVGGAEAAFDKGDQAQSDHEQEVLELRAKVGQLVLENDFLERGLERTHGPKGKKW